MKYCKECGVYVQDDLVRCPLCGSQSSKVSAPTPDGLTDYEEKIEPIVHYPKVNYLDDSARYHRKQRIFWTIFLIIGVCVAINLLLSKDSLWSAYVAVGGVLLYFCCISAIFRHSRVYSILTTCAFMVSAGLFAFDCIQSVDAVGNLSLMHVSLEYLIPAFLLAVLIALDVLIFVGKNTYRYYFISLFLATLLSFVPQIVIWAIPRSYVFWFSFSLFFFAALNCALMTIFFWKKVKNEFARKFHV